MLIGADNELEVLLCEDGLMPVPDGLTGDVELTDGYGGVNEEIEELADTPVPEAGKLDKIVLERALAGIVGLTLEYTGGV